MEREGSLETVLESPLVAVGATMLAAFVPPSVFAPIFASWPLLVTIPAAERRYKRLKTALEETEATLRAQAEAIKNLTDGQYDFVSSTIMTMLNASEVEKIGFLKTAIKNGLREPIEQYEAQWLSRILRDISSDEARFLIESIKFRVIHINHRSDDQEALTVPHDSRERLIVSGLVSVGILTQSDVIYADVNSYVFSEIAPKVARLLTE
jgi:hypothetical protein